LGGNPFPAGPKKEVPEVGIRTKEFYNFQNRVMEELEKTKLSPNDNKYCWALFRETCGYGDYKTRISRERISDLTHISETHVSDVERRLKERNIIVVSGKIKGFNPDIAKWEKVQVSGLFEKVQVSGLKGPGRAEKKGPGIGTLLTKKKEYSKKGGGVLKRLKIKAVEKLEGKKWLKQVMWQRYSFKEEFIDKILNKWEFEACYDVFLAYEESHGVRNKEAWFLSKLEQGPVPVE
jgi:phage replication O-like protein O